MCIVTEISHNVKMSSPGHAGVWFVMAVSFLSLILQQHNGEATMQLASSTRHIITDFLYLDDKISLWCVFAFYSYSRTNQFKHSNFFS